MCCLVAALQWQEQRVAHRQVASNTNYKAAQVCWAELVALKCLCLITVEEFSLVTVLTKQKKEKNPFSIDQVLVGVGFLGFLVMSVIT